VRYFLVFLLQPLSLVTGCGAGGGSLPVPGTAANAGFVKHRRASGIRKGQSGLKTGVARLVPVFAAGAERFYSISRMR